MDEVMPDRLRGLLDLILEVLDQGLDGEEVAGRAFLSRFHFDRLVASGLGEPPGTFRRRLLLERAAWRLSRGSSVTDAGLEAGYGSTEAFSRAFSRAYGVPPGRFDDAAGDFRLVAPNGIHFHAPEPEPTVRAMLDRLVWTKEVWVAAIEGSDFPSGSDRTIAGLRDRWASAGTRWLELVRRIRDQDEWQDIFVDAL